MPELLSLFQTLLPAPIHDPLSLASNVNVDAGLLQAVGKPSEHSKVFQVIVSKVGPGPIIEKQANSF